MVHDLEKKRVDCIKTKERLKRDEENNFKPFKVTFYTVMAPCYIALYSYFKYSKSADQLEREKNDVKWETSKVREDLCLAHEAYQFFRNKYKKRYGTMTPPPDVFRYKVSLFGQKGQYVALLLQDGWGEAKKDLTTAKAFTKK